MNSVHVGKSGMIKVQIIKDSLNPDFNSRITTMILEYPRIVHSELMTHRCLVGGTKLIFDLPAGSPKSKYRKYEMSIEDFYEKWKNGAKDRKPSRSTPFNFNSVASERIYTAKELASSVGLKSASNIRSACRTGKLISQNPEKKKTEDFLILGSDFIEYKSKSNNYKQNMRSRLEGMNIRMLDVNTGEVKHTNISDIWLVGEKETYTLTAGGYTITGTYDHPILTDSGWKNLSDITSDDRIVIVSNKQTTKKDQKRLQFIDGKWRSRWQAEMRDKMVNTQAGICSNCNEESNLEIHHLKPVFSHPELAFDEKNVVAICRKCHKETHRVQGWQDGNPLSASFQKVDSVIKTGKIEKVYDLTVTDSNHNFVANGIVVHNCFSRNSSSSRAIPIQKVIDMVNTNPAMPVSFGRNQPGMQAKEELQGEDFNDAVELWKLSAYSAVNLAKAMKDMGLHKQVVNRILEPYQFMKVCITSTNWNNWFELRNHSDADPTIKELAEVMLEAMNSSNIDILKSDDWHIPFVDFSRDVEGNQVFYSNNEIVSLETALMISCSCAAQTSYRLLNSSKEKAIEIYKKLIESKPAHASPWEHCAKVIQNKFPKDLLNYFTINGVTHVDRNGIPWSGNFYGWVQYRQLIDDNVKMY